MKVKTIPVIIALLGGGVASADANHDAAVQAIEQKAQLDGASAERAQKIMERYREPIGDLRRANRETIHELRALLRTERPDEKRVKKLEDQVFAARTKLQQLKAERMHELEKALTPAELGRLLVAWTRVNRAIRHAHAAQG
jgi:hypothetical protein